MQSSKVERVGGAHDISPPEYAQRQQVSSQIQDCFRSFGYLPVELPIVEQDDLYLLKSGEAVISKMYEFVHHNTHLCLRPEITASVARAYVSGQLGGPGFPARFQYRGPVFQSDRQTTQVGLELIGAAGTLADAEVIAATSSCLSRLGVTDYRLVVGHVAIATQFLDNLGLEERLSNLLLSQLDKLATSEGRQAVRQLVADTYPAFDGPDVATGNLWKLFENQSDAQAKTTVLELLDSLNIELSGNRSEGEIADRLLTKIRRQDCSAEVEQALAFLGELSQVRGDFATALDRASNLLDRYQCDSLALQELQEIAALLRAYNIDDGQISLDFGIAQGFRYYTGLVFQVIHPTLGADRPLCGGGRYDNLIASLGGESTPATGCSFDLERLMTALAPLPNPKSSGVQVLVVAEASHDYGIRVAEALRQAGISVQLDAQRPPSPQHIPWTIRLGAPEQQQQTVRLERDDRQQVVTIAAAIYQIQQQIPSP
jgi:histidyl-tRNA synthetase